MKNIGTFKVVSGQVYITDPCYEKGTWCQALVNKVKNGCWEASVDRRDGRNAVLFVRNVEFPASPYGFVELPEEIGVDSGQAGVFDAKFYFNPTSIPDDFVKNCPDKWEDMMKWKEEASAFYAACCDRTLGPTGDGRLSEGFYCAGTIPYGAVSSSGYGDGAYTASVKYHDDGEIIAIKIEFIPEDEGCEFCGSKRCEGECQDEDNYDEND